MSFPNQDKIIPPFTITMKPLPNQQQSSHLTPTVSPSTEARFSSTFPVSRSIKINPKACAYQAQLQNYEAQAIYRENLMYQRISKIRHGMNLTSASVSTFYLDQNLQQAMSSKQISFANLDDPHLDEDYREEGIFEMDL